MRLFIAVRPSPGVVEALAAVPRPERAGVRWLPPESWHVTVRFLGRVDDPAPVSDALATAATGLRPVEAVVGPAVATLGRGVLMVPVAGLDSVAVVVRDATAAFGQPPEPRPFLGHVTLARVKGDSPRSLAGAPVAGRWIVDALHLMRSHTSSAGARYETVSVHRLGE